MPQAYSINLPHAYNTSTPTAQVSSENSVWYPDSGATHHVTHDPQTLVDLALYHSNEQLQVGNGASLLIHSIGYSSLKLKKYPMKLVNVLHVPETQKNLLSIYPLTNDNDVYVEFHADHCIVKDEAIRTPLLKGTIKEGLYLLSQSNNLKAYLRQKVASDL